MIQASLETDLNRSLMSTISVYTLAPSLLHILGTSVIRMIALESMGWSGSFTLAQLSIFITLLGVADVLTNVLLCRESGQQLWYWEQASGRLVSCYWGFLGTDQVFRRIQIRTCSSRSSQVASSSRWLRGWATTCWPQVREIKPQCFFQCWSCFWQLNTIRHASVWALGLLRFF